MAPVVTTQLDTMLETPLTADTELDEASSQTMTLPVPTDAHALFVCSSGGHLDQLIRLRPWWAGIQRSWVTFDLPDARSRLADEQVEHAYFPTTRHIPNLVRNLGLAWRVLRRERPDLVISTGAAVALPFFLVAKALGIKTVYLEVFDRVDSPTLTGRLCRPLSNLFLVQWPEQQAMYPGSLCIGSVYQ